MALVNGDWSLGGAGPGDAASWTISAVPKGMYASEYTETDPPGLIGGLVTTCFESWSVDAWVDDLTLLEAAEYTQNLHADPDDRVEDFENEWPQGALFIDDLVFLEAAEYVDAVAGGTQPVEDFELIPVTVFVGTDALYIDEVNGGTQAFEDFERIPLTDLIGHLAAAVYEGPWTFELFDITTFWTNPDDQMKTM